MKRPRAPSTTPSHSSSIVTLIIMASRVAMVLAWAAGVSGFRVGYSASLTQSQVIPIRASLHSFAPPQVPFAIAVTTTTPTTSHIPPTAGDAAITNTTWATEDRGACQLEVWQLLGGCGGGGARWQKI